MRLISTEHGQAFQQLAAEEVRPPAGLYWPDFLRSIVQRYGFVSSSDLETAFKEGAKFAHGRLVHENGNIEIKEMSIYSDGIIIVTLNTNYSNLIFEDFTSWTVSELGFRTAPILQPRRFQSSVIVEFNVAVDKALGAFEELKAQFSDIINTQHGFREQITASRLTFSIDPAKLPRFYSFDFTLERRANSLLAQNRYFSFANLTTELHLTLLENLERRLLAI